MLSRIALASFALLAIVPAARANPAISVTSQAVGDLSALPATVNHRLTLTAGATDEKLTISAIGPMRISGNTINQQPTAVASPTMTCGTKWARFHLPYGDRSTFRVTLTVPAGGTAIVDSAVTFKHAPWAGDDLDGQWEITPASGTAFSIVSPAPFYAGPSGVELGFSLQRRSRGVYAVSGTAAPDVGSGKVDLYGYAPGRSKATRLATARVRGGEWSIKRLDFRLLGSWEFYARYRGGKDFANDASECGLPVSVR